MSTDLARLEFSRFCFAYPSPTNAISINKEGWRYSIGEASYDDLKQLVASDRLSQWTEEVFPLRNADIIELGPQEGLMTARLEAFGAKSVVAIEANAESFLRCIMLKNILNLRAQFFLGDFVKYLKSPSTKSDVIYASGVLYHLSDPIDFLKDCSNVADRLYLWTLYYDKALIEAHRFESKCFIETSKQNYSGDLFTLHKRVYHRDILSTKIYSGGLQSFANWLSINDIYRALEKFGYAIKRSVPDMCSGVPAMNIWATK